MTALDAHFFYQSLRILQENFRKNSDSGTSKSHRKICIVSVQSTEVPRKLFRKFSRRLFITNRSKIYDALLHYFVVGYEDSLSAVVYELDDPVRSQRYVGHRSQQAGALHVFPGLIF
jgi:hypothetical protein